MAGPIFLDDARNIIPSSLMSVCFFSFFYLLLIFFDLQNFIPTFQFIFLLDLVYVLSIDIFLFELFYIFKFIFNFIIF